VGADALMKKEADCGSPAAAQWVLHCEGFQAATGLRGRLRPPRQLQWRRASLPAGSRSKVASPSLGDITAPSAPGSGRSAREDFSRVRPH